MPGWQRIRYDRVLAWSLPPLARFRIASFPPPDARIRARAGFVLRPRPVRGQTNGRIMLDLRWRNLVASRPNALALHDAASGRSWTFADMAAAADSLPSAGSGAFVHPSGMGAEIGRAHV